MRKSKRIIAMVAAVCIAVPVIAVLGLYLASRHVPRFYRQVILAESDVQRQAGDELEQQVFQLHNDVQREGRWEMVLTQQQINGWLAVDLPEKFPHALPDGICAPRVQIDPSRATIACRCSHGQWSAVVSLVVEVHLTEEPNVVAVRICKARAGMIPLPLKRWLDEATAAASRANVPLHWAQVDGDPVALITIPSENQAAPRRQRLVRTIQLRDGEIHLAGETVAYDRPRAISAAARQGVDQPSEKRTFQQ